MLNFQGIILYLIAFTSPDIGQCIYFIIYFLVDDIINFEINLSSLMKPFSYMTKKSGQNKKCLGFHASLRVRFFFDDAVRLCDPRHYRSDIKNISL